MTYQEIVERYIKICILRNEGKTFRRIGEIFGVHQNCISQRYNKGFPKNPAKPKTHGLSHLFSGRELTRELVRIRDNHSCRNCGKNWEKGQRKFDIHHLNGVCGKKSRSYDKIEDIPKLITLCHRCHLNLPEVKEKMRIGQIACG